MECTASLCMSDFYVFSIPRLGTTAAGDRRPSSGSSGSNSHVATTIPKKPKKSRRCLLTVALPLLVIVAAGAVLGGIYGSKQHAAAGNKSQDTMAFKVTLSAPAKNTAQGCSDWFGSSEVGDVSL